MKKQLTIQTNDACVKHGEFVVGHTLVHVTPQVFVEPGERFWWLRVELSDKQALVAFPKFGTIGIGFEHEDDWNTNLPYQCLPEKIYDHIKHNKFDESIEDETCREAIRLLQKTIAELWSSHSEERVKKMQDRDRKEMEDANREKD